MKLRQRCVPVINALHHFNFTRLFTTYQGRSQFAQTPW